jgi:hypothetical protein
VYRYSSRSCQRAISLLRRLPRFYTAHTHCALEPAISVLCISLPTTTADRTLPAICLWPTSRRRTAHSLLSPRPEQSLRSEARPTHYILNINSNLNYTILYDLKTLINILYAFYCDCNCVESHSIPHLFCHGDMENVTTFTSTSSLCTMCKSYKFSNSVF